MTYLVRVLPAAEQDLDLIVDRLSAKAVSGAAAWIEAYEHALNSLLQQPERNALAIEARRVRQPIREYLFKTRHGHRYRLIYLVVENEVRVLRIRAPGERLLRLSDFE
jgi:plasmid stabilization system protein ParE